MLSAFDRADEGRAFSAKSKYFGQKLWDVNISSQSLLFYRFELFTKYLTCILAVFALVLTYLFRHAKIICLHCLYSSFSFRACISLAYRIKTLSHDI